jgi:hypothetical protein
LTLLDASASELVHVFCRRVFETRCFFFISFLFSLQFVRVCVRVRAVCSILVVDVVCGDVPFGNIQEIF